MVHGNGGAVSRKETLFGKSENSRYMRSYRSGSNTLLTQPKWLDGIIQRTNTLQFVTIGDDVPENFSFPLRLKLTDGKTIVASLKEASTLKGIYYQKQSHSIVVSPAGLASYSSLWSFISKAEKDRLGQNSIWKQ